MNHITDNHDALLDYLYEEGDPAERLMIATHLQECAACAVAVLEFQNVRGMLSDWTPPASLLGFRIVQDADASPSASAGPPSAPVNHGARGGWWRGWGPATTKESLRGWGPATPREGLRSRALFQAAAGILLFVSGMAVSQLEVRVQRGESPGPAEQAEPVARGWITLTPEGGTNDNAPLDNDGIMRDSRERLQNASSVDTERLLQRVRSMIDQSEQRQQRELALRVSQVAREVETQHQVDVQRIEQNFGQQQDATMEYLVRTSGGTK